MNDFDPMLPRGTDKCKCAACGLYFNSTYAFDQHRKGPYGINTRYCLTLADMKNAAWRVSPTGHWLTPRRTVGFVERRRQA